MKPTPSIACLVIAFCAAQLSHAQERLVFVGRVKASGTLESVEPGALSVRDSRGELLRLKIQEKSDGYVPLAGARARINAPATVSVTGELPLDTLKTGQLVRCQVTISRRGATSGEATGLTLVDDDAPQGIAFESPPENLRDKAPAVVTGVVVRVARKKLTVTVPKTEELRKPSLNLRLPKKSRLLVNSTNHRLARAGDTVEEVVARKLNTGELVVESLKLRLSADADRSESAASELARKHRNLSDAPMPPRDIRTKHFLLHTDISERSAAVLIEKLETMVDLVSQYYGRTTRQPIECYVVRDLSQWSAYPIEEGGAAKIRSGEGVTISRTLGKQSRSIVYSCDKHGVVQHESVHAFCFQTFGSTGPTWYSEGMAEMGNYWKEGEKAVSVPPHTIDFLKAAKKKELKEIVKAGQVTGDSWEAYSWRWALCHLLAGNPNYSGRFKQLGIGMMQKKQVSFETAYGDLAPQIAFEYDLFCRQVDNGYRADLAAWDWKAKFRAASIRPNKTEVRAARGWQPSGVKLRAEQAYDVAAKGEWKTGPAEAVTADGAERGAGRLLGVVMNGFKLSEPFELGERATFTAPTDGDLYLRCQDAWHQIADNQGELTVYVRKAAKE